MRIFQNPAGGLEIVSESIEESAFLKKLNNGQVIFLKRISDGYQDCLIIRGKE